MERSRFPNWADYFTVTPGVVKAPVRFQLVVASPGIRCFISGRIADEVISHLSGLVGANVKVTLEIEAEILSGAPDNVVRTVTENGQTLKFKNQGFEKE